MAKLQAYALQDNGLDTAEANEALGLPIDFRDYSLPVAILHYLGIRRVRLFTNNPDKCQALERAGIDVAEKIACEAAPNPNSIAYLKAKREKMGHTLRLCISEEPPHAMNPTAESIHGAQESARNESRMPGFASIEDVI
jgi:hypothetical protein